MIVGYRTVALAGLAAALLFAAPHTAASRQGSLPIFPGAQGFGTHTRAAYGGSTAPAVLRVTNLNDSGPGSLRAALEASGPRVVIFEISGMITLESRLQVRHPYLTVAGQTAPSPGITVRGSQITIRHTHDILIQHIRSRPGDEPVGHSLSNRDAFEILGNSYNVVLDHVSGSWAVDENFSISRIDGTQPRDVTISNTIISEALKDVKPSSPASHGLLIRNGTRRISVIRTLFAHNNQRNPSIQNNSEVAWLNNVIYHWAGAGGFSGATRMTGSTTDTNPFFVSAVNNVYVRGPGSTGTIHAVRTRENIGPGSQLYLSGTLLINPFPGNGSLDLYRNEADFDPRVSKAPVWHDSLVILPGNQVEGHVLANAGARPWDRDAVDVRVTREVAERRGRVIDSQRDVGGWPALAVNQRSLTLPADPHAVQPSGYTRLEEWLHAYATGGQSTTGGPQLSPPTGLRIVR